MTPWATDRENCTALGQYSPGDREQTGIDEAEAIRVMLEKYEIVRSIFRPDTKGGFDYRPALKADAKAQDRLAIMAGAIDWVLTVQQADAAKETTEDGKKRAHRRYADAVVGAIDGVRARGGKRRGT
jgi:type I restriction enzyme R subunit